MVLTYSLEQLLSVSQKCSALGSESDGRYSLVGLTGSSANGVCLWGLVTFKYHLGHGNWLVVFLLPTLSRGTEDEQSWGWVAFGHKLPSTLP